jgi:hypothetical protein
MTEELDPKPGDGVTNQTTENPELDLRLNKQSEALRKISEKNNSLEGQLTEMKEMLGQLIPKTEEKKTEEPKTKTKVSPEQQLSFDAMQTRLDALEAKDKKKSGAAKLTHLGRALERYGVDASNSDKVAKMLQVDLGDALVVDESGPEIVVNVTNGEEVITADKYAQMFLESDAGSIFKTNGKKSPTPKKSASTAGTSNNEATLSMIEFSKKVAAQFTEGTKKADAIKNAQAFKLKTDEN